MIKQIEKWKEKVKEVIERKKVKRVRKAEVEKKKGKGTRRRIKKGFLKKKKTSKKKKGNKIGKSIKKPRVKINEKGK